MTQGMLCMCDCMVKEVVKHSKIKLHAQPSFGISGQSGEAGQIKLHQNENK